MLYLKNKKTKQIGKFSCPQGQFEGKDKKKKWVSDWENATQEEINNFELSKIKIDLINKRKSYLKSTDWYDIRSINGKKVPKEIQNKRQKTREEINEIKDIKILKDLKKYEV